MKFFEMKFSDKNFSETVRTRVPDDMDIVTEYMATARANRLELQAEF